MTEVSYDPLPKCQVGDVIHIIPCSKSINVLLGVLCWYVQVGVFLERYRCPFVPGGDVILTPVSILLGIVPGDDSCIPPNPLPADR